MQALIFQHTGEIGLTEVAEPSLQADHEAIIRVSLAALSSEDFALSDGATGTPLGRQAVGHVEACGAEVAHLQVGDRVVICASGPCGKCYFCQQGQPADCGDPGGVEPLALHAEKARIPHADSSLIKLPSSISDEQAVLLSKIAPAGYFAVELAGVEQGEWVAVIGCGPVGQIALACAKMLGAEKLFAIDDHQLRLQNAREQGADILHLREGDPRERIAESHEGRAPDRVIVTHGGAPQWLDLAVNLTRRQGTLSIAANLAQNHSDFPIGLANAKQLTIKAGDAYPGDYIPRLFQLIEAGRIDPQKILGRGSAAVAAQPALADFGKSISQWLCMAPTADSAQVWPAAREPGKGSNGKLEEGLDESFPASDPPASTLPKEARSGNRPGGQEH